MKYLFPPNKSTKKNKNISEIIKKRLISNFNTCYRFLNTIMESFLKKIDEHLLEVRSYDGTG
ncbi:MAG: hypothetical protein APR62_11925 [Smithella sp. SDB]|nr:MAG: hypothetical protein APR62_11925 [Smithella sp. SDB]